MSKLIEQQGAPNLDGVAPSELWEFWSATNSVRPIRMARRLFPDRPKGYVAVTRNLGCYASNRATAMKCRAEGKISIALDYEAICDRIYDRLPEYAKW
jgi:hypothetical protein